MTRHLSARYWIGNLCWEALYLGCRSGKIWSEDTEFVSFICDVARATACVLQTRIAADLNGKRAGRMLLWLKIVFSIPLFANCLEELALRTEVVERETAFCDTGHFTKERNSRKWYLDGRGSETSGGDLAVASFICDIARVMCTQ